MRVLITGANGFIGSYLCKYFMKTGHEVIALSRTFLPEVKQELSGSFFIESDILTESFQEIKVKCDAIVHLAAANDIVSKNRLKGIELSSVGTYNVLKFAITNNIKRLAFFSTLQVYGTELSGLYSENSEVKPENDYGINHIFGEFYCEMFSRMTDLSILILRPSNIYGDIISPNINRWTLVPGSFIKEFKENGSMTLLSSGKQMRNFISLEQLSYCVLQCLTHMKKKYDIINLVGSEYKTIYDIAKITSDIISTEKRIEVSPTIKSLNPAQTNYFGVKIDKLSEYNINFLETIKEFNLTSEISKMVKKVGIAPNVV